MASREQLIAGAKMYQQLCEASLFEVEVDYNSTEDYVVGSKEIGIIKSFFANTLGIAVGLPDLFRGITLSRNSIVTTEELEGSSTTEDIIYEKIYEEMSNGVTRDTAYSTIASFNLNNMESWEDIQEHLFCNPILEGTDIDTLWDIWKKVESGEKKLEESCEELRALYADIRDYFKKFVNPDAVMNVMFDNILDWMSEQCDCVDVSYHIQEQKEIIPFGRWLLKNKDAYRKDKEIFDCLIQIMRQIKYAPRPIMWNMDKGIKRVGDTYLILSCSGGVSDGYSGGYASDLTDPIPYQIGLEIYSTYMSYIKEMYGFCVE